MSASPDLKFLQGAENLRLAANMHGRPNVDLPAPKGPGIQAILSAAMGLARQQGRRPAAHSCQQRLRLAFYFDGQGQQLHGSQGGSILPSNVASLYLSRVPDSSAEATYSFYVPGLGAPFKDIGDPGEVSEAAFLSRGEARLQWALKKLEEKRAATEKLCGIDVYLFGFSRGAALARAFANHLGKLGQPGPGGVVLAANPPVELEVRFMGLWDTVAAIGPAVTVANIEKLGLTNESLLPSELTQDSEAKTPWRSRHVSAVAYTLYIPRAAQLLSWAATHPGWMGEMAIPGWVKAGTHLIAGHENRNSFPIETTMQGKRQPEAFVGEECIYPGTHADMGGGYSVGSAPPAGRQLALVALNVMHEKAVRAGAPLRSLDDPKTSASVRLRFARSGLGDPPANRLVADEYASLLQLWRAYVQAASDNLAPGSTREPDLASRSIGSWFAIHTKFRFMWRLSVLVSRTNSPGQSEDKTHSRQDPLQALKDQRLGQDAQYLYGHAYETQRRFHAYEDLAVMYSDLRSYAKGMDKRVFQFLDAYVYLPSDGGESDATLPSDPRIAYVGGEEWLQFSNDVVRDCAFARPSGSEFVSSQTLLSRRWAKTYSVSSPGAPAPASNFITQQFNRARSTLVQSWDEFFDVPEIQVLTVDGQPIQIARERGGTAHARPDRRTWTNAQLIAAVVKLPPFLRQYLSDVVVMADESPGSNEQQAVAANVLPWNESDPDEPAPRDIFVYPTRQAVYRGEFLDRTMLHESGHLWFNHVWHRRPDRVDRWVRAMASDRRSTSEYGQTDHKEDAAEFVVLFVTAIYTPCEATLRKTFPARFAELRRLLEETGFKRDLALSDWPAG